MFEQLKNQINAAIDNFDAEDAIREAIDSMDAGELLDSIRQNMDAGDILDAIGDDLDRSQVVRLVSDFGLESAIIEDMSSYDLQIELTDRGDYFDGIDSEQLVTELENRGDLALAVEAGGIDLTDVTDDDFLNEARDRGFMVTTKERAEKTQELVATLLDIARAMSEAR